MRQKFFKSEAFFTHIPHEVKKTYCVTATSSCKMEPQDVLQVQKAEKSFAKAIPVRLVIVAGKYNVL